MNKKINKSELESLIDNGWVFLDERVAVSKTYKFKSKTFCKYDGRAYYVKSICFLYSIAGFYRRMGTSSFSYRIDRL